MNSLFTIFVLFLCLGLSAQLSFVSGPELTNTSGWQVSFELSEAADVEVSIVNTADSTVVRHLAAGMLGAAAPAPLTQNALSQQIEWDGQDDLGITVANPESLSVRVRAGMSLAMDKTTPPDPYQVGSQVGGVAVDSAGNAYLFGATGTLRQSTLRQYDPDGNYIKTIYPFPGNLSVDQVRGYGIYEWGTSQWSPKSSFDSFLQNNFSLVGNFSSWLMGGLVEGNLALFNKGWTVQKIALSGAMVEQKALVT